MGGVKVGVAVRANLLAALTVLLLVGNSAAGLLGREFAGVRRHRNEPGNEPTNDMLAGGFGSYVSLDDEEVQISLGVALSTLESSSPLQGVKHPIVPDSVTLVEVESQVVAGMNYRMKFDVLDAGDNLHRLQATVYVPLPFPASPPELTDASRVQAFPGGPWRKLPDGDATAIAAAEDALNNMNAMSNALFPAKLDAIRGAYAAPAASGGTRFHVVYAHSAHPPLRGEPGAAEDAAPRAGTRPGVNTADVVQGSNGGFVVAEVSSLA